MPAESNHDDFCVKGASLRNCKGKDLKITKLNVLLLHLFAGEGSCGTLVGIDLSVAFSALEETPYAPVVTAV